MKKKMGTWGLATDLSWGIMWILLGMSVFVNPEGSLGEVVNSLGNWSVVVVLLMYAVVVIGCQRIMCVVEGIIDYIKQD